MVRECVALLVLAMTPGCSLILDFDEALPADAAIDAVYSQAECDYFEPNDTLATAHAATATDTGPAAICSTPGTEDHDFYKFSATGGTVTVGIQFTSRAGGDLDIKLYRESDMTMVAQSRDFGGSEMITCPGSSPACPTLAAGAYILEVFPGVSGSVNSYRFSIAAQ